MLNHDDAKELMLKIKSILEEQGIDFMPAFGTLLGIIRDGDFIPNDHDMDLMIYGKDRQRLIDLIPVFHQHGIVFTRCYEPWVYTFTYKGADCDFYPLVDAGWPYCYRYYRLTGKYIQKNFFDNTEKVDFIGTQFDVPKNPTKYLEYAYGKQWRVPQSRHARTQSILLFHIYSYRFMKRAWGYVKRHYLQKAVKKINRGV